MLSVAADCYDAKQDTEISVDSGSVYGLLHYGTKPLPILIYNQRFCGIRRRAILPEVHKNLISHMGRKIIFL